MTLVCDFCSAPPTDDESTHCPCGGKYIDSRVRYEREQEEAWAVEAMFDRYHAAKDAEPTYSEGCLFKRQAGGVR